MQAWQDVLAVRREDLVHQRIFVAELDRQPVGFCSVMPDAPNWSLEHMWVLPEFMGRGVGEALFESAVNQVRTEGGHTLTIESDPNAQGFYERMGATKIGEVAAPVVGTKRYLPLLVLKVR